MQLSSLVYLTLISTLLTHCADNDDEKKLKNEKQQLAQENKTLQDALAANSMQSKTELSKKEDELARQTDQLTHKANELKDEQDKNQAAIEGLEQEINVKTAAAAALEKAVATEKENVAKANEKIRVASIETKTLKDERDNLKNELLKKEELLLSATTTEARIKLDIKAIEEKLTEKEAKIKDLDRSLQEMTANSNDDKLKNLMTELENEKSQRGALETELANFRNSMASTLNPFWGLYYSPSTLSLAGTECRIFAYADEKGNFTQAFVCDDGKMQWSNSRIQTFDAVIDTSLDGNYGLKMKVSEPTLSSCVNGQQSGLSIGSAYTFSREATFGGAIFSAKASIDYEGAKVVLDNASIKFKSNECEDLIARYNNQANGFNKDEMAILKNAVLVCDAVAGKDVKAGCFTSNDTFN